MVIEVFPVDSSGEGEGFSSLKPFLLNEVTMNQDKYHTMQMAPSRTCHIMDRISSYVSLHPNEFPVPRDQ